MAAMLKITKLIYPINRLIDLREFAMLMQNRLLTHPSSQHLCPHTIGRYHNLKLDVEVCHGDANRSVSNISKFKMTAICNFKSH